MAQISWHEYSKSLIWDYVCNLTLSRWMSEYFGETEFKVEIGRIINDLLRASLWWTVARQRHFPDDVKCKNERSADFPGEWALGFDRAALFLRVSVDMNRLLLSMTVSFQNPFLSSLIQDSGTVASSSLLKAAHLSPLFAWETFLLLPCSWRSRWSAATPVRQQRLCSRPTRQQINRPVRSCWNRSGTLQNCRGTNVGHLPRCLFFFFLWGTLVAVAHWYLFLLLVNSGEAGEDVH